MRNVLISGLALAASGVIVSGCAAVAAGPSLVSATLEPQATSPQVVLTYEVQCPRGDLFVLQVDLTQTGAVGTSRTAPPVHGVCTGGVQRTSDTVRSTSGTLRTGAAQVLTSFASSPGRYPSVLGTPSVATVVVH